MATDATTSVIAIEYTPNGLPLAIQGERLLIRRFQVIDEKQINKIIRDMSPTATVIVDTEAFHGHGSLTARKYVRAIREVYDEKPSVLFLRYGAPSDDIIENDKLAGATDVLYHSALTGTNDAKRMNHFIRDGVLPPPPERKKPVGNVSGIVNALHYHEQNIGNLADDDDTLDEEIPTPKDSEEPPKKATRALAQPATPLPKPARIELPKQTKVSPVPESHPKQTVVPVKSKPDELGDDEMEALLAVLSELTKTLMHQNTQILNALGGIQDAVNGLRADKENAVLAQVQEEVSTAMGVIFTQLRRDGGAHHAMVPVPVNTDTRDVSADTNPTGSNETPPPKPSVAPIKDAPPIAEIVKHGWKGDVILFNRTLSLPYGAAELFAHLINTGKTMGTQDIASLYELGRQGGYFRMSHLRKSLDEYRKGLSSCLTPVKSGNSIDYRFDEAKFREIMKVK